MRTQRTVPERERAMLSHFSILKLEGWTTSFALVFDAKPLERVLLFLSFILLGTFVVLKLLLVIMSGSLEEVRQKFPQRLSSRGT